MEVKPEEVERLHNKSELRKHPEEECLAEVEATKVELRRHLEETAQKEAALAEAEDPPPVLE